MTSGGGKPVPDPDEEVGVKGQQDTQSGGDTRVGGKIESGGDTRVGGDVQSGGDTRIVE